MRILYVANSHIWGGGEQAVLLAARLMAQRGHEVALAAPRGSPLADRVQHLDGLVDFIEVALGPKLGRQSVSDFLWNAWRYHRELCEVPRRGRGGHWNVVHLQYKKEQLLGTGALAQRGYRVAWTEHGGLPPALLANPVAIAWYRRAAYATSGIACVSRYVAESLAAARVRSVSMPVIHNGVDERAFVFESSRRAAWREAVMGALGWSADSIVVGTVCRLASRKGLDRLVAAAVQAMRMCEAVHLLIVGEGAERAALEAMIPESMVRRAAFAGFQRDVPRYLAAIDIFVSPTEDPGEGFGLRVAEAMMAGVPVVATRFGGHPEVVTDGLTGILVPPRDGAALTRSIMRLATNAEERLAMGRRAQQDAVRRFGSETFAAAHEAFLDACCTRPAISIVDSEAS